MRSLLIGVFIIAIASTNSSAQVSFKTEYFGSSGYQIVCYGDVDHPVPGQIDHWVS